MRKAGGLAGVGEGEREGTPYQQNSTPYQQNSTPYQQNSIDQSFKTALYRFLPTD
jgi:hypothetical protein